MAGGRPTDYTLELLEKATQYAHLAVYPAIEERVVQTPTLPSVAGLALNLKVARSTIYEWAKTYPEFSDILERVLSAQEDRLFYFGLNNKWNASVVKLALGKHGYRESQDITTDGKALPTPILGAATKDENN